MLRNWGDQLALCGHSLWLICSAGGVDLLGDVEMGLWGLVTSGQMGLWAVGTLEAAGPLLWPKAVALMMPHMLPEACFLPGWRRAGS